MTTPQIQIIAILAAAIALFVSGRLRHDLVAACVLLACVGLGLVSPDHAFDGFSNPAVVTVACVLILSSALQETGAVDALTRAVMPKAAGPRRTLLVLCGLVAFLSAFMNNVGAMALLMPVALQMARRLELPPGRLLMPIAFSSIFGGMTTLIGTPPNLIVAGFRDKVGGAAFGMFDFTPAGLGVAATGVAFIALVGWRLVPERRGASADAFHTGAYLTEAQAPLDSAAVGRTLGDIESDLAEADATIVGLVRGDLPIAAPDPRRTVHGGDILLIEADPEKLSTAFGAIGLRLAADLRRRPADARGEDDARAGKSDAAEKADESRSADKQEEPPDLAATLAAGDVSLIEVVVRPGSRLAYRSARDMALRDTYRVNLLAVSRQGQRTVSRLRELPIRPGDVLLLQGRPADVAQLAADVQLVPLADRNIRLTSPTRAALAGAIMVGAIALGAFGLVPTALGFAAGAVAVAIVGLVPIRRLYDPVDWSVIVLLAAMMPVADAVSSTGAADLLARVAIGGLARGDAVIALALVLVVTMTLSDVINNAATAAMMCPIAVGAAHNLGVAPDAFLMAVAIGASCAFLTPIGHQNNTLILGPGGFRFGDYWRLGAPLELIVVAIGLPALLIFWPLRP